MAIFATFSMIKYDEPTPKFVRVGIQHNEQRLTALVSTMTRNGSMALLTPFIAARNMTNGARTSC